MATATKEPTDMQVKVLMSDWLGGQRDDKTFIHKNTKGTIRREMKSGESLSNYFLGDTSSMTPLELMKEARNIAQSVVDGMTDKNVNVHLGAASMTNGQTICIATDYFDDNSISTGEKIDTLIGYSVHETAHVLHSDFDRLKSEMEKNGPLEKQVKGTIANIIEDERIEFKIGEKMPGLSDYLGCCKERCFDGYENLKKATAVNSEKNPVTSFLNTLLLAVRYPKSLTENKVKEHFDELDRVRKILTPFPTTTEAVFDATDKIYDVMKDIVKKELEKKKQEEQKAQQRQQSAEGGQKQPQSGNAGQNDGQGNPSDGNAPGMGDSQGQPQNGNSLSRKETASNQQGKSNENSGQAGEESGNSDQTSGGAGGNGAGGGDASDKNGVSDSSGTQKTKAPTKKEIEKELAKCLSDQNTQKLLEAMNESIDAPEAGSGHDSRQISTDNNMAVVNGEAEIEDTALGTMIVKKVPGSEYSYNEAFNAVRQYVPSMTKALKCRTEDRDYTLMGERSGRLNTNKLVSLLCGNENIFIRQGHITCDSACICILIDESGSMSGEREKAARRTAVLVNEAVKHIDNLELFIYGFSGKSMNIYCERKNANRWALGCTSSCGGTPTGEAMAVAAKRIRKLSQNPCLMLVITDGEPNDIGKVIKMDEEVRKLKITPIGLGINNAPVEQIFRESISFSNISELAPKVGQLVKKRLLKTLKRHDSLR